MYIITQGFTKSVWGVITTNVQPRESKSRIIVRPGRHDNGMFLPTGYTPYYDGECPFDRVMENTLSNSILMVDLL
ncbi:MAG: hypothetical protein ABIV39_08950 [Verrucomicrobiota bacterium]